MLPWSALSPAVGLMTFLFRDQGQVQCVVLTPRGEHWKAASGSSLVLAAGQASMASLLHHICLGDFLGSLDLGQKVALRINQFQCFYGAFGALPHSLDSVFPFLLISNHTC